MKKVKQIFAMALAVMMLVSIVPMDTQAAGKFKMNKSSTTIYVGKSTTLSVVRTNTIRTSDNSTIKVTGTKKKVKWHSSNKNIAKVSSKGKVTGRKAGKVVITAKVSGKKYTCKVKVKNPYLSDTKKTITAGKSFTLKMKGSSVVKWSSSDKSVATVSSKGKVKAKAKGTAIIRCKCKNGKTYKCKVTVKKKSSSNNSNTGNTNGEDEYGSFYTGKDGHLHKYKKVKTIREASASGFGEIEYTCSVKGCKKTVVMNYGNPVKYEYTDPDTKKVTKTETKYGFWDEKSAKDILEGINEYRKSKGLSTLKWQSRYNSYLQKQVMQNYFGNIDFNLTPEDKSLRFVGEGLGSDCHNKTYFKTKAGLLKPGNDGKNNAALFEKEDIEVGVACFAYTVYYSPTKNNSQQYYSYEYFQPSTHYDIVICIFENNKNNETDDE